MTDWSAFSPADFDATRAPRGAARRAAEAAEAGQAGLFFAPTPTRPAKTAAKTEPLPGEVALFESTEEERLTGGSADDTRLPAGEKF